MQAEVRFAPLPSSFMLQFDARSDSAIDVSVGSGRAFDDTPAVKGWRTYQVEYRRISGRGGSAWSVRSAGRFEALRSADAESAAVLAPDIRLRSAAGVVARFRNLRLRPLGLTPLFNGKDLSGWKPFVGDKYKSKFDVTPAGELHAVNGPGDLQTEGTFGDFVLQLECKTNGKGLNSGVFFRCLPGQYQQGYEMQIQNSYVGDRSKPLDFGTGAVYRRVPARKVVSNDNEWFAMTLIARGPHISTWVNGYQTVSWTDDRKPDENPRKGLRTGPGHLSLQGHDPTTDLLFRNIRVAEMTRDKR